LIHRRIVMPENTILMPDARTQLQRFTPTDGAIAMIADQYMPLVIQGPDDSVGFKAVHSARMVVKGHRVEVEKVRKELKADALRYGQAVDAEARRITGMLEPIETHLAAEENAHEAAKEAIRNAARLKAEAEARAAADAEAARLKAEHDAEVERLRIEREKLDTERKAMEAERAKIEAAAAAERARQKAEQDKIDAERRIVEAEQKQLAEIEAARLLAIEKERIRKEAAEKAQIETEARIAREAAEKKAADEAKAAIAEAARIRELSLRPDREKLLAVMAAVVAIEIPAVSSNAKQAARQVQAVLVGAASKIEAIVEGM